MTVVHPSPDSVPIPVFVLAPKGRSGTTWLCNLLRMHPDAAIPAAPLAREDWLLHFSHHLRLYSQSIEQRVGTRNHEPEDASGFAARAMAGFGRAMLALAMPADSQASHIVFKTPTLAGIRNAADMFPNGRVVVIVRDGRASVESSMRSWPQFFDNNLSLATQRWAEAIRELLQLMDDMPGRLMTVRYEDLYLDPQRRLRVLLRYCGLDPAAFDPAWLERVPLRGSSVHRPWRGDLSWKGMPVPGDFDPLGRFSHWSAEQHRAFNRIAADCLEAFGYRPQ